jgi:AraC-like DNA-binding protein
VSFSQSPLQAIRTFPEDVPLFESREEVCVSDRLHSPWQKHYDKSGIGFVISGWFEYRGRAGTVTGVPGTLLFGNRDEDFSVDHLGSSGIKRLVVWYDREFLQNVAAEYGLDNASFPMVALPPGKAAANAFTRMLAVARGWADAEDAACALAGTALTVNTGRLRDTEISARDRQRMLAVVEYIATSYRGNCAVENLAAMSGLSRFRFMRLFKAVTGQTVNQYVINTRLRAAAARLVETKTPIGEIALDTGFNDISYFNTCFRTAFACSPRQLRKRLGA